MASTSALHVLIVDDEPLARQRLRDLLERRDDVAEISEAVDGDEAVRAIRSDAPDLVFLDVQMPGRSGIDVVEDIGADRMPVAIFVTAYDSYTLQAFEYAALDYLLKPFDDDRFERAMARAKETLQLQALGEMKDRFLALFDEERDPGSGPAETDDGSYLKRITVESKGRVEIVSVDDIDYITSDGAYLRLHTEKKSYLVRERMKILEERLNPDVFFRIHRSTTVRLERIDALLRRSGGRYAVRLADGTRLAVSRSRREALEQKLKE